MAKSRPNSVPRSTPPPLALLLFLLPGCLPSGVDAPVSPALFPPTGSTQASAETPFTFLSSNPASGLVLTPAQPVAVTFTKSLVGPCSVSGGDTLPAAAPTFSYNGDTVSVNATGIWNTGIGLTLNVTCTDATGTSATARLAFQRPSATVYIRPAPFGSALNPGTAALPKDTVTNALAACASPCAILAADGNYPGEVIAPGAIQFTLIGGYSTDFSVWAPATYHSRFFDVSGLNGAIGAPTFALQISAAPNAYIRSIEAVASTTGAVPGLISASAIYLTGGTVVLHGVNAIGCPAGSCTSVRESTAVFLDGGVTAGILASAMAGGDCGSAISCSAHGLSESVGSGASMLILAFSVVSGGHALTPGSSCGVMLYTGKAFGSYIEKNWIAGGTAQTTCGLSLPGVAFTGPIERNVFNGGLAVNGGSGATGVQMTGFSDIFRSNVVFGGTVPTGGTASTRAIQVNSGSPRLYNNIFDGGRPETANATGMLTMGAPTPDVQNNLFTGNSVSGSNICWLGNNPGAVPTQFLNNGFHNCTSPAVRAGGVDYPLLCTGSFFDIAGCGINALTGGVLNNSGNVIAATAPGWINPASLDYRFRSDGSALCSITQGGLPLVAGELDASFFVRTTPWSMGPYEYDGPCQ